MSGPTLAHRLRERASQKRKMADLWTGVIAYREEVLNLRVDAALLDEAAAALGNVAPWRGDPEKMLERERRKATEEAERNAVE